MSMWRVCWSRAGRSLASVRGAGALWRPAALLLSLSLGACSSAGPTMQAAGWSPAVLTGSTTGIPPAMADRPQVEIEGDGLEGQTPPRRRAEKAPDDPTEPYSPNYGSAPPAPSSNPAAPA